MEKETEARVSRFQGLLAEKGIDGALIVQTVDLYYLSGTDQDAHLWVPASGDPLLMVRKSLERARMDAATRQIVFLEGLSQIPEWIRKHSGGLPRTLGMELDVVPFNLARTYEGIFRDVPIMDISSLIRRVRTVKDPLEQSLIRGAARMGDRLLEEIPRLLEESETETDLAARAEFFYRRLGHPGVTRVRGFNIQATTGHIAAGASSALPSASPGPTGGGGYGPYLSQGAAPVRISPREPILVDYLASVEGYYADQARIFSIGELPARFSEAHRVMIEIQETLALKGLPGARAGDLYGMALEIAKKAGLGEYFMGHPQPVPFVGHGIGLELDEWPVIAKNSQHILEEGMVIALEPKVVFPGQGVLGIEDTFLVSERGMEKLNRFPEEIQVLPGPPT